MYPPPNNHNDHNHCLLEYASLIAPFSLSTYHASPAKEKYDSFEDPPIAK